ncbi:hypothetical protein DFH07DRAFT_796241 [Mycena maculata]|uniref:Uncharacterized protein n=1 Tax=Mycena maculata TaxID=230809 RepID=A0AAD7NX58_9AGAR|nr:hypothetical protein DFH07DRAFT_796241 [Mycena maculata]
MDMPRPKRKRGEPDAPRLNTRTTNKKTRPAVKAGLAKADGPTQRRSTDEMEEARRVEAESQAAETGRKTAALARVSAIVDEQRAEDDNYSATARHPTDLPSPVRRTSPSDVTEDPAGGGKEGSGDDSDEFIPPKGSSGDEGDGDVDASEPESEADDPAPRGRKPAKPAGADLNAKKRKAPGKKADQNKPHKKTKLAKKAGLVSHPKRGASSASGRSSIIAGPGEEDDSMSRFGGPALDDDMGEQLERPKKSGKGKKSGLPATTDINIASVPPRRLTKKEQRGNAKKWTLQHLPPGTSSQFTNGVAPLVRELAGTLHPWAGLTVAQMQHIVDRVYKQGSFAPADAKHDPNAVVHTVDEDGPWWGLINYRLTDWRATFATFGATAINEIITAGIEAAKAAAAAAKEKGQICITVILFSLINADIEAAEAAAAAAKEKVAQVAKESDATVKAAQAAQDEDNDKDVPEDEPEDEPATTFDYTTPAGIAQFIAWALQVHEESGTMAFHWEQWGDGEDKKGFFFSYPIAFAYTHHMAALDSIPAQYDRLEARPCGAILLAMQAVHRSPCPSSNF